jgi:hypothetical protein
MSNRTRIVTISGVLCSIVCVAMLHIARTDLSPHPLGSASTPTDLTAG